MCVGTFAYALLLLLLSVQPRPSGFRSAITQGVRVHLYLNVCELYGAVNHLCAVVVLLPASQSVFCDRS